MIFHVIVALVTWYAKKSTEIVYGIGNWTKYVKVVVLPVTQKLGKNTIKSR